MKNLKFTHVLSVFLAGVLLYMAYKLGRNNAPSVVETQSEIAERYIKYIGNPETVAEQCTFEYVIYGDCDED